MDYGSIVIAAGISLYGFFEYRRRERVHSERMDQLHRGITPRPLAAAPTQSMVLLTGVLATVLVAVCAVLLLVAARNGRNGLPLAVLAGIFFSFAVFLIAMAVRDAKLIRATHTQS